MLRSLNGKRDSFLFSIIVPCYNCEKTLRTTLESLLEQYDNSGAVMNNYQIVLVDDGATDSTGTICDEYLAKFNNIRVIHKNNGGLVDAWKTGVDCAQGDYIAFCDSDDYVDHDLLFKITSLIDIYHPDVIAYGMVNEYPGGKVEKQTIIPEEGYYDYKLIYDSFLPRLLSNGGMQTVLISSSRCNKIISKQLLQKIVEDVPLDVSYGEDDITCFAIELNMKSIYIMQNYYPYHYVRNSGTMIGGYDPGLFDKIDRLSKTLSAIAKRYGYQYNNQIRDAILSLLFLAMKKEISRNTGGYSDARNRIENVLNSDLFKSCYSEESIKQYKIVERVFAKLISCHVIAAAYLITRIIDRVRGRGI